MSWVAAKKLRGRKMHIKKNTFGGNSEKKKIKLLSSQKLVIIE
jgi:hypothetical protein